MSKTVESTMPLAPPRELLDAVLRHLDDAVTVLRPGAELVYANDKAAQLIGYASAEKLLAESGSVLDRFQLLHEDGSPLDPGELPGRRALAGEEPEPLLVRFRSVAGGGDRLSLVKAVPVRDDEGVVRYVITYFREVTTERRLAQRQWLAAEAGEVLNATLDYSETLHAVANLAVPALADWCLLDVRTPDGLLERVVTAHADPARAELLRDLSARWPSEPDDPSGPYEVARTGMPTITPEVTDEALAGLAKSEDHLHALRELGLSSAASVPIVAGDDLLGVLTLVTAESPRRLDEGDVAAAQDLAARAAAAIRNAALYREARRTTALLDSLYASAPVGLGFWDAELRFVRVNEALAAMNERPAADHVGRGLGEVVPQLADVVTPIAQRVLESGKPLVGIEITGGSPSAPHDRRDWIASYYPVLADGEVLGVGAVVEEVTERRRAERRTGVQHAVSRTLAEAETAADAVPPVLQALCEMLDWDFACYWPVDPDEPRPMWVRPGTSPEGFVAMTERLSLSPSLLPGRVAASGVPEWAEVLKTTRFARARVATAEGLRSAVAFPVLAGRDVIGVIEAFSAMQRPRDDELIESLTALGAQLGQFLSRKRAEEERMQLLRGERHARAEAEAAAATLRKLERVAQAALEHLSLRDLLNALLARIVEVLEADTAAILLLDDDDHLRVRATVGLERELERAVPVPLGAGLAGSVAASRRSRLVPDLSAVELVSPVLRERGINSLVAIPLVVEERVIGVLHAGSEAYAQFVEEDARLLELIADRIALAIQQASLYEAERVAQQRLQFLAEASTLLASSLDVDETLGRVAKLAVPHLADWCAVDLLGRGGSIRRLAVAHVDPAKVELAERLAALNPPSIDDERGVGSVIRTREPVLVPEIDEAMLRTTLADRPDYLDMLLRLRLRSVAIVPLVARGAALGALTFVWAESGKSYGDADVALVQELAARAAVAVDNANLYLEAEHGRRRLGLLAEASALLGSTLQVESTLEQLGSLVVGRVADWCTIHLLDDLGNVRVATVSHRDPTRTAAAREEVAAYARATRPPAFVQQAIETGEPFLFGEVSPIDAPEGSFEHSEGIHSGIVVPLVARARPVGALTLARAETPAKYTDADVEFALDLAHRAAVAIDNAQLYRAAEERAQAARVLASVGDGVFLVDRLGIVRTWNHAASAVTGLEAGDVVDRPAVEAIPGWAAIAARVPVAAGGSTAPRAESLPLDVRDRELWLSIHGVAVPDGIVYAFRDLTEERALESMRTEFVSTVSHELRTPLAAIYGAAMTLRRSDVALDAEQRSRLLEVVSGEADRLARTVNDILWASRLDSDSLHVSISSCDPVALARDVVEAQRAHLDDSHELVLAHEDDLPHVAGDPDKVARVLINLVDNGVKYSPDGGRVEVRVEQAGSHVRFSVVDPGLGIPPAEQRRVFEKFYRLDPNMTRGVGGTGLGLYICRELVRRMDGRIWVDSHGLGRGSAFHVELPLT